MNAAGEAEESDEGKPRSAHLGFFVRSRFPVFGAVLFVLLSRLGLMDVGEMIGPIR